MHKIEFYVPITHAEKVKEAMFNAGAGKTGQYDRCCWQTEGTGQFRPLPGSSPAIGQHGKIEKIQELKVEMVCKTTCLAAVINTLLDTHPYEVPAWGIYEMKTSPESESLIN